MCTCSRYVSLLCTPANKVQGVILKSPLLSGCLSFYMDVSLQTQLCPSFKLFRFYMKYLNRTSIKFCMSEILTRFSRALSLRLFLTTNQLLLLYQCYNKIGLNMAWFLNSSRFELVYQKYTTKQSSGIKVGLQLSEYLYIP